MKIPTMLRLFAWCFSLSSMFWMQATFSAPLNLPCPSQYPDDRQLSKMRGDGWYAPSSGVAGSALNQAGALTGTADQNGELRGSDLPSGKGRRFEFDGTADDGDKWVFCNYESGRADVRLMYPLPVQAKRCETDEKRLHERVLAAATRCI